MTNHPDHASHSSCCDSYANHNHAQWRDVCGCPRGEGQSRRVLHGVPNGLADKTDSNCFCTGRMGWHGIGSDLTHTHGLEQHDSGLFSQLVLALDLVSSFLFPFLSFPSPPLGHPLPWLAASYTHAHTTPTYYYCASSTSHPLSHTHSRPHTHHTHTFFCV